MYIVWSLNVVTSHIAYVHSPVSGIVLLSVLVCNEAALVKLMHDYSTKNWPSLVSMVQGQLTTAQPVEGVAARTKWCTGLHAWTGIATGS